MPKKDDPQFSVSKPREYKEWQCTKTGKKLDVRGMNKQQRSDTIRRHADKHGYDVRILD